MLIRMRVLAAGSALVAVLAVAPAGTATAAPVAAVRGGILNGVACLRADRCWAVGSQSGVRVLIERWNGSRWLVAASPVAPSTDTSLNAVSCASTSSCWAVGGAAIGTAQFEPIAEHWNGRTWRQTVLAEPSGATSAELFGVSCPAAGRCWAAGAINPGIRSAQPLVEHWTGKRWSVVPDTVAAGNVLNAVTCRRDTNCWAVGIGDVRAPAEHWNGTKWSLAARPETGGGLNGVSCPGTDCFAVGESGFPAPMAERWNGSAWSIMPMPLPAGEVFGAFGGVSCISSSDCFAVGGYGKANHGVTRVATIVERLRGSRWVIVRSPNPAGAGWADLIGVACTSARACWAVGNRKRTESATFGRTLAERWNGTHWSIVPTP